MATFISMLFTEKGYSAAIQVWTELFGHETHIITCHAEVMSICMSHVMSCFIIFFFLRKFSIKRSIPKKLLSKCHFGSK
jgi:hypothetical protein